MVRKLTAAEAEARFHQVLAKAAAGEVIEITRRGQTVARLVPEFGPYALKGLMTGAAMSSADDEELFTTSAPLDRE